MPAPDVHPIAEVCAADVPAGVPGMAGRPYRLVPEGYERHGRVKTGRYVDETGRVYSFAEARRLLEADPAAEPHVATFRVTRIMEVAGAATAAAAVPLVLLFPVDAFGLPGAFALLSPALPSAVGTWRSRVELRDAVCAFNASGHDAALAATLPPHGPSDGVPAAAVALARTLRERQGQAASPQTEAADARLVWGYATAGHDADEILRAAADGWAALGPSATLADALDRGFAAPAVVPDG